MADPGAPNRLTTAINRKLADIAARNDPSEVARAKDLLAKYNASKSRPVAQADPFAQSPPSAIGTPLYPPSPLEQAVSTVRGELNAPAAGSPPEAYDRPAAGGGGSGLAGQENAARDEANRLLGRGQVSGQTPEQAATAAQAALGAGGPKVLGYTKGGFVPSTRQSSAQREHMELPPGYSAVASEELAQDKLAGQRGIAQDNAVLEQARMNSKVQRHMEDIHREAVEQADAEEEHALSGAQAKIDSAIAEFKAGGPKMITYGDIWRDADTGGKVTQAVGMLLGSLGSLGRRNGNGFLEELDRTIERKIRIQEMESQRDAQAIGYASNAYQTMRQRFQDQETTRAALYAMYMRQFQAHVNEKAAEVGLGAGDVRLAELNSKLLEKQRGIMEKFSSKVLEQEQNAEKYAAPTAILGDLGPKLDKDGNSPATKYELERMKAELPQAASAVNELRALASSMGPEDRGYLEQLARRRAAQEPGSWTEFLLRSAHPEKTQKMIGAVNTLVQALGGKTLPPQESARYVSGFIGDGSPESILRGADEAQRKIDKLEETLHSAYPEGYRVGNLQRTIYRNTEQPHELEGEEKAPDLNKRVISPEAQRRAQDIRGR